MKLKLFLILGGIFLGAGCGQNSDTGDVGTTGDPSETMVVRVEAAMNSGGRSTDDKAIDANRKPAEILACIGRRRLLHRTFVCCCWSRRYGLYAKQSGFGPAKRCGYWRPISRRTASQC